MIIANFNAYASYVTDSLYQWDINQKLTVRGLNLSVAPEVHFSNKNMDRAIVRQSTLTDYIVEVDIPNSLLQTSLRIYAHIGVYEGKTFKVIETVEIPIKARPRPADYQIEDSDEEIYSFKKLENMVRNINDGLIELNDETITAKVNEWLSEHPESVTTPVFGVDVDNFDLTDNLLNSDKWTLGVGWSGSFDIGFTHSVGKNAVLECAVDSYDAAPYVLKFTATNQYSSSTEHCLLVSVGGSPLFEQYQDDGTVTKYFTFYPSEGGIVFTPSANWSGKITDIGLYKIDSSALLESSLVIKDSEGEEAFAITATKADLKNIIIGKNSLRKVISANRNIAIGDDVLTETATGYFNIAIGDRSQKYSINGTRNVSIGHNALTNITNGDRNIAVGTFALSRVTTGRNNVGIGADAGWYTTSGSHNVAISNGALNANTEGSYNVAIGHYANPANTTGEQNISIGYLSNGYNTSGNFNTALGYFAHYQGNDDRFNIAIGYQAMSNHGANASNTDNIAIGRQAMKKNVGNCNIAIGFNALLSPTTETGYNIALGYDTMSQSVASDTEGDNIVIGHSSGRNIAGNQNIAVGRGALNKECSHYNIAIGSTALSVTTGSGNVGVGLQALKNATTGNNNIAIGYTAGSNVNTASNCICIGNNGQNVDNGVYIGNLIAYNGSTMGLFGVSPVNNARLLLPAGTTDTAPLQINKGPLTTTPHVGSIEFDGTHLYFVNQSGVRKQIAEV